MNLRELAKRLAALERRVATVILPGTAQRSEGSKTVVRFDEKGADGQPFESPLLSHVASSGKKGSGVSRFSRIGDGEPVFVISPGGELGKHSRIMPAGPVEDHPSPGTAEQDGEVLEFGDARISVRTDGTLIQKGDQSVLLKNDGSMSLTSKGSITVSGKDITLDGPVSMPKGFSARSAQGSDVAGVIEGELHTTHDITSQTKIAAPVLQGALQGA
ncbi:hypothetical protein AB4099_05510 [Bosea sp. 2KB_26]|uniref:hypothetical protein n=1 Tax=Bosea sp. 2KB_26 TaxID=3237475 RepID=UPI003F9300FA